MQKNSLFSFHFILGFGSFFVQFNKLLQCFFPLIIPSMLNYICICNGNLQYIDLLILFLARQSSKFSIERAVQLVGNPYLGRTSTIIGWVKKGEKREKQQSFIPHGSFTTGADFGPRTLHNVMMDHCATTLKSKKLFQQCSYILLRDPEASKDPTIIGYEPVSLVQVRVPATVCPFLPQLPPLRCSVPLP